MDPNDPICKAIVKNEKWTADLLGVSGYDFCSKMKIAHREIIGQTLVEFSHAWYNRDDNPPSVKEAVKWKRHVEKLHPEVKNFVFIHGHVHVPRYQVIENLTILCQGATGLPFDRDERGSVAFLKVFNDKIDWDVNRYKYNKDITFFSVRKEEASFLQQSYEYNQVSFYQKRYLIDNYINYIYFFYLFKCILITVQQHQFTLMFKI